MAKLTDVRQSFRSCNWRSDERENTSWSLTTFSGTLARQAGLAFYSFYYLDTHRDPSPTDLLWKMISKQVLIGGQVLAAPCCASKWGKDCTPSTFAGSLSTVGTDTGVSEKGGIGGYCPPNIGRLVNSISTRDADYANHMTTRPTRFSDLPTDHKQTDTC